MTGCSKAVTMAIMANAGNPIVIGFFILLMLWLAGLTYVVVRTLHHYNSLSKGISKQGLQAVLDTVLSDLRMYKDRITAMQEKVDQQAKDQQFTLQKISLVRFNPFADTGGEQSFIVGLLDKQNNGILITSLQGRTGTRWYAKQIKRGKGVKFDLSKEEEETVHKAKPLT